MPTTEAEKADLSKTRGVTAAHIPDSAEKRAYISKQGDAESKGTDKTPELKQEDFNMRNKLAVLGSMKKGGLVKKTGPYTLHKNEIVLPSPDVLTGKAPKTAGKKTKVVHVKKGKKLGKPETFHAAPKTKVASAMKEVHNNVPKNVVKTGKTGAAKESMLRAIAFSKAGEKK